MRPTQTASCIAVALVTCAFPFCVHGQIGTEPVAIRRAIVPGSDQWTLLSFDADGDDLTFGASGSLVVPARFSVPTQEQSSSNLRFADNGKLVEGVLVRKPDGGVECIQTQFDDLPGVQEPYSYRGHGNKGWMFLPGGDLLVYPELRSSEGSRLKTYKGLWRATRDGVLSAIAVPGQPAPGIDGATIREVGRIRSGGARGVAFSASLTLSDGSQGSAIWAMHPDTYDVSLIVRSGEEIPGAPGTLYGQVSAPVPAAPGSVWFQGEITAPSENETAAALMEWTDGIGVSPIAVSGYPAPGLESMSFEAVSSLRFNDHGYGILRASLMPGAGGVVKDYNDDVLWFIDLNGEVPELEAFVRNSSILPEVDGERISEIRSYRVADDGRVLLMARLRRDDLNRNATVTKANDECLWVRELENEEVLLVAREGDPAPGWDDWLYSDFKAMGFTSNGGVRFENVVVDPDHNPRAVGGYKSASWLASPTDGYDRITEDKPFGDSDIDHGWAWPRSDGKGVWYTQKIKDDRGRDRSRALMYFDAQSGEQTEVIREGADHAVGEEVSGEVRRLNFSDDPVSPNGELVFEVEFDRTSHILIASPAS